MTTLRRHLDSLYAHKWTVIVPSTAIAQIGMFLNIKVVVQHVVTHAIGLYKHI
jgi:hypothetical protein